MRNQVFEIAPEIEEALRKRGPVVALESTLISHGFPSPENLRVARLLEETVRREGAVPATIGIIEGRIKIGLSDEELERLAAGPDVHKVSRRDIPIVVAKGWDGGTTVAATMFIAHQAGIAVFATGGIGGVHRGNPFDVSADLAELSRTPVVVVCAGAKSILDLALTLEWLETHGVPVVGYGTDEFPAFYSRSSGLPVDCRLDDPAEVARLAKIKWQLGLEGGMVVAVPVPEEDEVPREEMEGYIEKAVTEAEEKGVSGKAITPFLLARIGELTGGRSRRANIALLKNNAAVAARIARALVLCQP